MANHVSSSYRAQPQKLCIVLLLLFTLVSHLQVVDGKNNKKKKKKNGFVNVAQENKKSQDKKIDKPIIEFIPGAEDKEIIEYEYDLELPGTYSKGQKEKIMHQFQETYNSMYTDMVVLSAEVIDEQVNVDPPEVESLNLRNLRRSFSRISMRARASGKNVGARRPLFRSSNKRNRILALEAPDEEEIFLKQFAENVESRLHKKEMDQGISAELLHIAPSDKTPREVFFSFRARMILKGATEMFKGDVKKEIMKDFQIAYNNMFWHSTKLNSLVVEMKYMKQKLRRRKNNSTDVVCRLNGIMYTDYDHGIVKDDFESTNTTVGNYKFLNKKIKLKFLNTFDKLLAQSSHAGRLEGLNGGP